MFPVLLLGSCDKEGCTNPNSINYNPDATTDDGSCQIPTLSTIPLIFSGQTVESGGIISSDGGSATTLRGVCWATTQNPTIADDTTLNGSGTGSFSSIINNLEINTTYYLRAYATNSNGTGYGDELSFTIAPGIGYTFQGGIIFYLDSNGGGLIAAPADQSTGAEWGCYGTTISGEDGTAIGTGAQNTTDIEAVCTTPGTAADICANLTLGGYTDWFLPSIDELNEMYLIIGQGNPLGFNNNLNIGGFANSKYWSSTQITNESARYQNFDNGIQGNSLKFGTAYYVRAARAF